MVGLLDLENMMVIFNIKCYFLSEWEGVPPTLSVSVYYLPFSLFSGVELELCLLSENVKNFIKW